jgi:hypothetical protein
MFFMLLGAQNKELQMFLNFKNKGTKQRTQEKKE